MADRRKLQSEIDRCLKKVTEGVEIFEDIWQKVHTATNANQKDKYETDLKKEIKKLQRLRDQIKTWTASSDIKDKRQLQENRRIIETQMERFKVIERETKTKAYSKEALSGGTTGVGIHPGTGHPREAGKGRSNRKSGRKLAKKNLTGDGKNEVNEMKAWITSLIEKLRNQTSAFEEEIEAAVQNSKKKKLEKEKQDRVDQLRKLVEKHKYHAKNLDIVFRMLDSSLVDCESIKNIKDDLEFYIESCQDPDFKENEYIYEDFNLDETNEDDSYTPSTNSPASPAPSSPHTPFGSHHLSRNLFEDDLNSGSLNNTVKDMEDTMGESFLENSAEDRDLNALDKSLYSQDSPNSIGQKLESTFESDHKNAKEVDKESVTGTEIHLDRSSFIPLESARNTKTSELFQRQQLEKEVDESFRVTDSLKYIASQAIFKDSVEPQLNQRAPEPNPTNKTQNLSRISILQKLLLKPQIPQQLPNLQPSINLGHNPSHPDINSLNSLPTQPPYLSDSNYQTNASSLSFSTSSSLLQAAMRDFNLSNTTTIAATTNINNNNNSDSDRFIAMGHTHTDNKKFIEDVLSRMIVANNTNYESRDVTRHFSSSNLHDLNPPDNSSSYYDNQNADSEALDNFARQNLDGINKFSRRYKDQNLNIRNNQRQNTGAQEAEVMVPALFGACPLGPIMPLSNRDAWRLRMIDGSFLADRRLPIKCTDFNSPDISSGDAGNEILGPEGGWEELYCGGINKKSERLVTLCYDRNKCHLNRIQYPTPTYYNNFLPSCPSNLMESSEFYNKLSTETLFFIFYYFEGSKSQYMAAKTLKKLSWRFHTKYLMWFQRHEEPKTITDEYEQGTYIYFDYEKWSQRRKDGFTFEYKFLEDKDLN
ncbi:unnamed protein product [Gordionus sp. m RMFG-2023]|uniref:CCR4-NOT transcription complex subunit 3-like n=1 Tax=Gordionus sp. m RMFG-2023 TaxID=3053472 RepID=UPI0030DFC5D3